MNRGVILVVLLGLSLSIGLWPLARPYFPRTFGGIRNALPTPPTTTTKTELQLSSTEIHPAGLLPAQYTCDGRGVSPELHISGVPTGTTSLAITMIDIDVPALPAGKYYHWGVWNISPDTTTLASNSLPASALIGTNTAQKKAYAPPCPPSGEHRYVFTVYALRGATPLPKGGTVQQLLSTIPSQTISSASLVTRYRR